MFGSQQKTCIVSAEVRIQQEVCRSFAHGLTEERSMEFNV